MTDPLPPQPEPEAQAEQPEQPNPNKPHLVRCPHHGRLYNANRESGCRQCQEEGITADTPAAARPKPAAGAGGMSRGTLVGVLFGVAVVVALVFYLRRGQAPAAEPAAAIVAPARLGAGGDDAISRGRPRSGRWDPAVYEQPIRALETALYQLPAADASAAVDRADGAARLLIAQVLARNVTSGAAQPFRTALETAVARLRESAEGGYVLPDFYSARGNWERIRTEYFAAADWYHAPMAMEEVGVGVGGARQGAQEETPAYYKVSAYANDLERIMNAGRETLLSFPGRGERQVTADEAAQLATQYEMFSRQWNDDLDQAERVGPRTWRSSDSGFAALATATSQLGRALTALRAAAPPRAVPTRAIRTGSLQTATQSIARARQVLAAAAADST